MSDVRWLDEDDQRAWRPLAELVLTMSPYLDETLQPHGLNFFEYSMLSVLSHAPDRTRRMSELAELANGSLSRVSHGARRLERRGLVERCQCPTDGRVTLVSLTDEGYALLSQAAPDHVESVRRAFFDTLSPEQAQQLGQLATTILTEIAPNNRWIQQAKSR